MIILKKFISILILIILLIGITAFPVFSYEEDNEENDETVELIESLMVNSENTNSPEVHSAHIVAIDRNTERILYEKNAFDKTPMASTTKILTSIIAIENCNLSDTVHISSKAAHTNGSTLGITADTDMRMEDLLYGLMLRSGNDCAVAIAEHIGGDLEGFSSIMNEKAQKLGLSNSHFVTPHGLDADSHYTTAYELALLTNYALKNETFRKIVSTKEIVICNRYKTHT